MQSRAEIRAVEREDTRFVSHKLDRLGFTRINHHVDVVLVEAKAMQLVGGLLNVGHMESDLITLVYFELVGFEAAPHGYHLGTDVAPIPLDLGILDITDRIRILV